jgi:hypothetical protein
MHWYDTNGNPQYEIKKKDGGMRATTLRDARKHGWVPSVTTVMDIVSKPGLEVWKVNKAIESAMTVDRHVGETYEEHAKRILAHSKQESEQAAKRGVRIHNELESFFRKGCVHSAVEGTFEADIKNICDATKAVLDVNCGEQDWVPEKSFCHKELGYGGKVDLYSDEWVIDFKTKDSIEDNKQLAYDAMAHQLMGYNKGIPHYMEHREDYWKERRIANVFISADNPGHVVFHEWPLDKHELYWNVFASALDLWKHMKNYRPEEFNNERD